jgi:acetyltransferase-like isoleucine patch superfamily enzyme
MPIKNFVKNFFKLIMYFYYTRKKEISISNKTTVSYKIIKNCGRKIKFINSVKCTGNVKIGSYTSINGPGTLINATLNEIKIGNFCSIAPGVKIFGENHKYNRVTSYFINQNIFNGNIKKDIWSKGDIIIEDDVWIGANSIILSGVHIGRGSIIGAGSVVTKNIDPYNIVGGNPAEKIKKRFKSDTIDLLEKLEWWKWDLEKLNDSKWIFELNENELLKALQNIQ